MKSKAKSKTLEFFTLFTTVVGMVIGVGIYFKMNNNPGGMLNVAKNPWIVLILLLVVAILSITMIVVFIEIASSSKDNESGNLANWFKKFINRKCASAVSIFNITLYTPIMYSVMAYLVVNFSFKAADVPYFEGKVFVEIAIAVVAMICFGLINTFTRNVGQWIQTVGFCLKFIPIIIALFIGYIYRATDNVFVNDQFKKWSVNNFFLAIAPILLAVDGFINAVNLRKEVLHKEVLSKALLFGMITIIVFYILIAVSLFLGTNNGDFFTLYDNAIGGWFSKVLSCFIIFVAILALNGWTFTGVSYISDNKEQKVLFFRKTVSQNKSGTIQLAIGVFWLIFLGLIGWVANKSEPWELLQEFATAAVILQFLLYSLIMLAAFVNRKIKKVDIEKTKFFIVSAIIAIPILFSFVGYIIFNTFFIDEKATKWLLLGASVFLVVSWAVNEYFLKLNIKKEHLAEQKKLDELLIEN